MSLERDIARRFSRSLRSDGFSTFTSIVSIASVAVGCLALIISISILDGYEKLILDTAMRYTSHVEIKSIYDTGISNSEALIQQIRKIDGVAAVHPIAMRESLVRSRSGLASAGIHGLDAHLISSMFADVISTGTIPKGRTCALGAVMARQLDVGVGDTLTFYTAQRTEESITPKLFALPISGIISTGMYAVDNSLVAVEAPVLTSLLGDNGTNNPSLIAVQVQQPENARSIANEIMDFSGTETIVFTWKDRFQSISSWIELQSKPIPVILALITVVAAFTMISTLFVSVVEKTRSISILFALGMPRRTVVKILLFRAMSVSALGSVIGSAIACSFAVVQNLWHPITLDGSVYYVSSLPISLEPLPYLMVPLFAIVLALLASLIPMLAASRINPVQGLRFQ